MEEKDLQEAQPEVNNEELEQCQADLAKWKDSFLRANADFENFKKRTIKEKSNWIHEARAEVILDLLGVVDNFDRALDQQNGADDSVAAWLQGFEMIHKSLYEMLTKYDVKPIAANLPFDPQFHEAISQVPSEDVESGQIVNTVQKGFMMKDHVLRPAKVVVAS